MCVITQMVNILRSMLGKITGLLIGVFLSSFQTKGVIQIPSFTFFSDDFLFSRFHLAAVPYLISSGPYSSCSTTIRPILAFFYILE